MDRVILESFIFPYTRGNSFVERKTITENIVRRIVLENYDILDKVVLNEEVAFLIKELNLKESVNEELINETVGEFLAALVLNPKTILLGIATVLKVPSFVISRISSALNDISKIIKDLTEDPKNVKKFINGMSPECKKILLNKEVNAVWKQLTQSPDEDSALDVHFMKPLPIGSIYDKKKLMISEAIKCAFEYYIQVLKVQLDLYYKCLMDNKAFMDLINIINTPVESVVSKDSKMIFKLVGSSKEQCSKYLKDFEKTLKLVLNVAEYIYGTTDRDKYRELVEKVRKVISELNKEYQKKLEKNKEEKERRKPSSSK